MRKLYAILFTALLSMVAFTASAINITVNVDDPSRVKVKVNYQEKEGIVAGDNVLEVAEYQSVCFEAADGAFLSKVVRKSTSYEEYISNMTTCYLYMNSTHEGETWTVTSVNSDEARDGKCRIYVDEASKVKVQRSGTYTTVELVDGWNDVKYITSSELPLLIGSSSYTTPLYSVTLDGQPVAAEGSAWRVTPGENSEIEIKANFPDIDVPVHFTYSDDEAKGFITGVQVDDVAVTDYNDANFTVKAGKKIAISGDTENYSLTSFKINGTQVSFYGSYSFVVTEATTIDVDAHKYGTVTATIDIDHPENVKVYKGYSYTAQLITLNEGKNTIELSEKNTMIQIYPESGCYIESVDANGTSISADYSNAYTITVTDGMVITVRSGAIERNQTAMVYIDDRQAAATYFNFQRGDRSSIDMVTGYNEVKLYDGDNPFGLSWYSPNSNYANVYKNDETVSPLYSGSTTYELQLADGDVVKVFLTCNPSTYNVTFDVTGDASNVSVTRDRIKTVDNWTGGFSALQGTEVSLAIAGEEEMDVTVNGKAVTAGEDGTFVFTVDAATTVGVNVKEATGITGVSASAAASSDVYSLQGVLVMKNASAEQLNSLPAGVYIVNGRKTVKH